MHIAASRERLRRSRQVSLGATFEYWGDRARLWMHNLMRPMALPIAGGLLSAVFIFGMMAPMYVNPDQNVVADVPTTLSVFPAPNSRLTPLKARTAWSPRP